MNLLGLAIFTGGQLHAQQCPRLRAIMVDACGLESGNEFMIIHSGSGFNTRDLQIDFDASANGDVKENNDINVNVDNFPNDIRACRFQPGNPSLVVGCDNVTIASQDTDIPENAIVIIQMSGDANTPIDYSYLCGNGECVYVLQNDCIRTKEAFDNNGSGGRTTVISVSNTNCELSYTYEPARLVGNDGAYYAPGGNNLYDNRGCVTPPVRGASIPPEFNQPDGVESCLSYTLPGIGGSNLTGNERYYTQPDGKGIMYRPGDLIRTSISLYLFDRTAPCSPQEVIRILITPTVTITPPSFAPVCAADGPITLETVLNGVDGTWSGKGVENNQFFPDRADSLIHTLTFTPDPNNLCGAGPASTTMEVLAGPNIPAGNVIEAACSGLTGGEGEFDLNAIAQRISGNSGNQVSWFSDQAVSIPILDTLLTSTPRQIFATLDNGICPSPPIPVDLQVSVPPEVSFTPLGVSCHGGSNGGFILDITGGSPPYEILWSDSSLNGQQEVTNLPPGQYGVTVVDAGDCEVVVPLPEIVEPELLVFSCNTLQDVTSLSGQDGIGNINFSGGTPPYIISWDGPVSDSTSFILTAGDLTIDNLLPGSYDVQIRDIFGCIATCQFVIGGPNCNLVLEHTQSDPTCVGATDGTIELTTSAGQGSVTYNWSDDNFDGQSSLNNLPAGVYEVSATDAVGCLRTLSITLQDPPALELSCEVSITPSALGASDGQARIEVAGGSPPYTASWTGPQSGNLAIAIPSEFLIDDLPAGTYEVVLVDANDCQQVCSFTLVDGDCDNVLNADVSNETCPGTADGSIELLLSGTWVTPLIIDWEDDQYDGQTAITNLSPGTYAVTVTGANSCSASISINIQSEFSIPEINFAEDAVTCATNCFTYQLDFTGTPPFFAEFMIRAGTQNIPIGINSDQTTSELIVCPADYGISSGSILIQLLRVSDANCINDQGKESTLTIGEAIEFDVLQNLCSGENVIVNGQVYDINRPTGREIIVGGSQSGCDSIINVNLSFAVPTSSTISEFLCIGDSLVVNNQVYNENRPSGSEIIQNTAGCDSTIVIDLSFYPPATSQLAIELCPGEEFQYPPSGQIYNAQNPGGIEILSGQSSNGCDSLVEITLTYIESPITLIRETICRADSLIVNGTVYNFDRPSGIETISDNNGATCDSIIDISLSFYEEARLVIAETFCPGEQIIVNGITYDITNPSGIERLVGQSSNGCDSIVEVNLDFIEVPPTIIRDTLCSTGSIIVNGTTYDINRPNGVENISGATINGCDSIVTIELFFLEDITVSLIGDQDICLSDSTSLQLQILNAPGPIDIQYTANGSNPIWVYGVEDGDQITVKPAATTSYVISDVVTPSGFCPVEILEDATVSVHQLMVDAEIVTDYEGYGVGCYNQQNGSVKAVILTGTGPFTYRWEDNSTLPERTNLGAGVYSVLVTDGAGCIAEASANLQAPPEVKMEITILATDCSPSQTGAIVIDTITGGNSVYQYSLNGETPEDVHQFPLTIGGLQPGPYTIEVFDEYGCQTSQSANIIQSSPLELILIQDQEIKLGESIRLDGDSDFVIDSLIWMSTDTAALPTGLPIRVRPYKTTTYTLIAFDNKGCSATAEVTITVNNEESVYVPTAFSPTGDGINDQFYPFTDNNIRQIMVFRVFDRWGTLMHEQFNFQGNQEAFGWDGKFKGKPMNAAVFIYYLKVEYIDGSTEIFKGDFALVK